MESKRKARFGARQNAGKPDRAVRPQPRDVKSRRAEGRLGPVQLRPSKEDFGEITTHVAELAKAVPVVHAVMNNNYEDQGQLGKDAFEAADEGRDT